MTILKTILGIVVSRKIYEEIIKEKKKLEQKINELQKEIEKMKILESENKKLKMELDKLTKKEEVIIGKNWKPENSNKARVNTEFGTPKKQTETTRSSQNNNHNHKKTNENHASKGTENSLSPLDVYHIVNNSNDYSSNSE